jgi:serine/threonine protein kinase
MKTLASRFVVDRNSEIREGGTAEVYAAFDSEQSMQRVAVKLFKDGIVAPSFVLESFSRECESLSELNTHSNTITLIDFGTDTETQRKYIALSWAPQNLVEHLRSSPLQGWDDFFEKFGRPTLSALCFAFSRGILHRDVKPQNILLDENLAVRVADFGISKFRKYYRPGITLAHFKSVPYAPEVDTEEYAESRDVFGYAVLALECLSPTQFETYEHVYSFLEDCDLPEDIYKILSRALSKQPEDRYPNVLELQLAIEATQRTRRKNNERKNVCHLSVSPKALERLKIELSERSELKAKQKLISDLNDLCGIDRWIHQGEPTDFFLLVTAEFEYQARIDEGCGVLQIVNVRRQLPSRLERQLERAWNPQFEFRNFERLVDTQGYETIRWLQDGFAEFEGERRIIEIQRKELELFDRWTSLLRLKSASEQLRETPIEYHRAEISGHRLLLAVNGDTNRELVTQARRIKKDDGSFVTGKIDSCPPGKIILYCDRPYDIEEIPQKGKLLYDTGKADSSIKRQFASLDSVRFDRATRSDLRGLLTGSQIVRTPSQIENETFFQIDLDADKKMAVNTALGVHDFLVVEGPPGTGKTKFITELILQFSKRNPGSRILLSSQTHSALDNALEKVRQLSKQCDFPLRLARIGRRDEEKISSEVSDLILENSVESWLQSAAQKSDLFLEDWAKRNEITIDYVRIGMALAALKLATRRCSNVEAEIELTRSKRTSIETQLLELRGRPEQGDEYREAEERLSICQRDLEAAEAELFSSREARRKAIKNAKAFPDLASDIETLDEADMASLEAHYINHAQGGTACQKLIAIVEEWKDRFGRSADFSSAYLSGCDVVAGTCLGVGGKGLQSIDFSLCIVDEASKATPTEMLVPISRSKRWVIVGDSKQLPPYVGDISENTELIDQYGLTLEAIKETLLDHLKAKVPNHSQTSLLSQHRMIKPIGNLISACFYESRLLNVNEKEDAMLSRCLVMPRPVTWFTTSRLALRREEETRVGKRREFRNWAELKVIENILRRLEFAATQGNRRYSVALLSGYGAQVQELESLTRRIARDVPSLDVTFGTVDSFQGREADICIYSITRSNETRTIGFLKERERLNVALSRGKVGLAIVGDSQFCDQVNGQNPFIDILSHIRLSPSECQIYEASL